MAFLKDGRLFVADGTDGAVYLLDPQSAAISRLGRTGSGPGEYRRPEVLGTTDQGRIVVRDMQQFRVISWNRDGSLHASTGPGSKRDGVIWAPVAVVRGGHLVTTAAAYGTPAPAGTLRRIMASVQVEDTDSRVVQTLGSFPFADFISLLLPMDGGGLIQGPRYFGWKLHVAAGPTFVVVGAGGERDVRTFGVGGDSIGVIHLAEARLPVTQQMRDALMARAQGGFQGAVTPTSFAPERFADSLPLFSNLLTTATGTVWVVAPSWERHAPASMTAYTLRGARLGGVQLPLGFTPLAATDSAVAGYLLDENEVATVAVYRVRVGSGGR
ncbi:MAG: hypothetical protein KBF28_01005 [Gemmatimonadales bacterium]|nr:hypothetical protein [Gemmatimonadales bacterium]